VWCFLPGVWALLFPLYLLGAVAAVLVRILYLLAWFVMPVDPHTGERFNWRGVPRLGGTSGASMPLAGGERTRERGANQPQASGRQSGRASADDARAGCLIASLDDPLVTAADGRLSVVARQPSRDAEQDRAVAKLVERFVQLHRRSVIPRMITQHSFGAPRATSSGRTASGPVCSWGSTVT